MRALIFLVLFLCLPSVAFAEPPCAVVTATVTDFVPRSPLEHVYFDTSVCYRKKWLDQVSLTRSCTASLAAAEIPMVEQSSIPWATYMVGAGAIMFSLALGFIFGHASK